MAESMQGDRFSLLDDSDISALISQALGRPIMASPEGAVTDSSVDVDAFEHQAAVKAALEVTPEPTVAELGQVEREVAEADLSEVVTAEAFEIDEVDETEETDELDEVDEEEPTSTPKRNGHTVDAFGSGSPNSSGGGKKKGRYRTRPVYDSDGTPGRQRREERADEDLVRLYLTDIGQFPLLTKDDEVELAKAIEKGDAARARLEASEGHLTPAEKRLIRKDVRAGEDAEKRFIQCNLRLVVSIAKKYQASGLPLLDLIQEGNLGLMHGVEKFDWRKGFKFSTYATWWIRQAITRGIANTGRQIRLPVHSVDAVNKLNKVKRGFQREGIEEPTLAQLAERMEMTEKRVKEILSWRDPMSFSEPLTEDGTTELGDVIPDPGSEAPFEKVTREADMVEKIDEAFRFLDEREKEILNLRFGRDRGEPRTLEEVGEHFNLTRERIRQIEARAMAKLRHPSTSGYGLRVYVDGDR